MSFKKAKGNVTAMEILLSDERKAGIKKKKSQNAMVSTDLSGTALNMRRKKRSAVRFTA